VIVDTVPVGNPGNAGDFRYAAWGPGAVSYGYRIGTYEVTAGQYTQFLNAVAADDAYLLYGPAMWSNTEGCKIERSGSPGTYTYAVAPDWADRPVNFVSWGDAARFANWMHNGQPVGPQGLNTTEDGSYFLNGATTVEALAVVTRQPDATWVIPTDYEWYKAAYHKNDGVSGNYWDYPTSSNSVPSNALIDPDPGNNANFLDVTYTVGSPYFRTVFGEFENSASPYGTFDQGGNVVEWTESMDGGWRGLRGGAYQQAGDNLHASYLQLADPATQLKQRGFRLALVPEPAAIVMLCVLGSRILRKR